MSTTKQITEQKHSSILAKLDKKFANARIPQTPDGRYHFSIENMEYGDRLTPNTGEPAFRSTVRITWSRDGKYVGSRKKQYHTLATEENLAYVLRMFRAIGFMGGLCDAETELSWFVGKQVVGDLVTRKRPDGSMFQNVHIRGLVDEENPLGVIVVAQPEDTSVESEG